MYVLMNIQLKRIPLQSGRGVNGQSFRADLNTCMLWFKILILDTVWSYGLRKRLSL
jgi:hypothetical protein